MNFSSDTLELAAENFSGRPANGVTRIEFDGGTSCNSAAKGFGLGYGSYRIDAGRPVRLRFSSMSNNCAEVLALLFAVQAAKERGAESFHIVGDSRIALRWADIAAGNRKLKGGGGTREFQKAVSLLIKALSGCSVTTQWQPRFTSVLTFGH
jgi:ribonuclease HI